MHINISVQCPDKRLWLSEYKSPAELNTGSLQLTLIWVLDSTTWHHRCVDTSIRSASIIIVLASAGICMLASAHMGTRSRMGQT